MTVRFASKINIINSSDAFMERYLQAPGIRSKFPWTDKTRVFTEENAWTDGICECNAGGFTTPKRAMIFHFQTRDYWWSHKHPGKLTTPDFYTPWEAFHAKIEKRDPIEPSDYGKALIADHAELQTTQDPKNPKNPKIRALLTGGNDGYNSSHCLREYLLDVYQTLKLPFSMLWGGTRRKDIHYAIADDTWTIQLPAIWADTKTDSKIERLKGLFSKIAIDPGDELWLANRRIPHKDLEKAGLLKTKTPEAKE